jgi:hypothetical protein
MIDMQRGSGSANSGITYSSTAVQLMQQGAVAALVVKAHHCNTVRFLAIRNRGGRGVRINNADSTDGCLLLAITAAGVTLVIWTTSF